MSDPQNTHGTPGPNEEADNASGGAPEDADEVLERETTDDEGKPLENPSGG
ncbi:hypothetical protein [Microbacterium sp.]|uniref:hypothetical protein n=1 Tax=Microbacterium sp. TaxID=51671 RepID=UPI003A8CA6A2